MPEISYKVIHNIVYIYGLIDPLSGNIRYIGKSIDPVGRLKGHISKIKNPKTHKEFWILSLLKLGLKPELIIIETTTELQSSEREIFWIAEYRARGFNLTNGTDGGGGALGLKHTEEAKRKNAEAHTGRKASEETRTKMSLIRIGKKNPKASEKLTGIKRSEETRTKMSQAKKGKKYTPETIAKIVSAKSGFVHSEETKKKMSESKIRYENNLTDEQRIKRSLDKIQREALLTHEEKSNRTLKGWQTRRMIKGVA